MLSTAAQHWYPLFKVVCFKFVPNVRFRATELKNIVIADSQTDRETNRRMDRQTDIHRQTGIHRQTDRQQTERLTARQADRQIDRPTLR